MTQKSYPLSGQPFPDDQWADVIGQMGDGILDDWGNPYSVTTNTNDTVTIGVSSTGVNHAVVNGFAHQMDAPEILTVPSVSAQTRYLAGLLYDPTNSALPVSLKVLSAAGFANPSVTAGKVFMPIVIYDRAPGQTLAAATRRIIRPRRAPTITVDNADALANMNPLYFLRGTRAHCLENGIDYIADGTATTSRWAPSTSGDSLYGDDTAGGVVRCANGQTTVIDRATVNVPADQVVEIAYTGLSQVVTSSANWAGGLSIIVDNVRHGVTRRVGNSGASGNGPIPMDRTVKVPLTRGDHSIVVNLSVDDASSTDVNVRYSQLEVWPA